MRSMISWSGIFIMWVVGVLLRLPFLLLILRCGIFEGSGLGSPCGKWRGERNRPVRRMGGGSISIFLWTSYWIVFRDIWTGDWRPLK